MRFCLSALSVRVFPFIACAALPLCAEDWPRFRGPTGQGVSTEKGLPTEWSATANVLWRTPIPGEGWSSPIVLGDKVWVTTATDGGKSLHVLCLDRQRGAVLWDIEVATQDAGHKNEQNSYATPTPATDGERIYVLACDGTFAALSPEGKVLWTNREFKFYGHHGLAVSPILYKDLVIAPFDGSNSGEDKALGWQKPWDRAVIVALDKASGKVRWKGSRGASRIAHVTPQVVVVDGADQLVSGAGDVVQGFDLATGARLWSVRSEGEGVVPSIVCGDGLAFSASGFGASAIRAVRLGGGKGEVTATHLAWENGDDVPMVPSMVYVKPHLFVLTEKGVLRGLDAASGKALWRERLRGEYYASPVWADGKLYCVSRKGETTVLEVGAQAKVVARNALGERCLASPAITQRCIFLRGEKHLYCIGAK